MSESESAKVSYYELLGVPTTATQQQIKKGASPFTFLFMAEISLFCSPGYRKAALRLHPDHNKSPVLNDLYLWVTHFWRVHVCRMQQCASRNWPGHTSVCRTQINERCTTRTEWYAVNFKRQMACSWCLRFSKTLQDDDQTQNFKDAKEYWRSVYRKITPNDIEEFKVAPFPCAWLRRKVSHWQMKYVGSLMEEEDLIS